MNVSELIDLIKTAPERVSFDQVMAVIAEHYRYTPVAFSNGVTGDEVHNEVGTNEGSCRLFAFARLNGLNETETLVCFGDYYRNDVLGHPEGSDHGNIRTFMRHGWPGIRFEGEALAIR